MQLPVPIQIGLTSLLCFGSALLITWIAIPVIIHVSQAKNLMDEPNFRSAHSYRTPNLGGIAMFGGILTSLSLWLNFADLPGIQFFIFALLVLFFIGLKDDLLIISAFKKFTAQAVAALAVIIFADLRLESLQGLFGVYALEYLTSVGLTLVVFVFLINAYNLIDGIDGLASGLGLIGVLFFGACFMLLGQQAYALMAIALGGALTGFLRFNFSDRQKIFMGDTGSMLLGFFMAVFAIRFLQLENVAPQLGFINSPIVAMSVLFIPIFDTFRVFLVRLLNGASPFFADKNHIHHLLLDQQFSHAQASAFLCAVNLLVIFAGIAWLHDVDLTLSCLLFVSLLIASAIFHRTRPNTEARLRRFSR